MFLDFKKWLKTIQTLGYNGMLTACIYAFKNVSRIFFFVFKEVHPLRLLDS